MSLLDDTIFSGPHGILRYIEPRWLENISRIKKLEIHTLKDREYGREDVFYLYAWGRVTNHKTRTPLNIRAIEITGVPTNDIAIQMISQAIENAIPVLQTALRLAGEP